MAVKKVIIAGLFGSCLLAITACEQNAPVQKNDAVRRENAELKNEIAQLVKRIDALEKRTSPILIDRGRPVIDWVRPVSTKSNWLGIERAMKIDELEHMGNPIPYNNLKSSSRVDWPPEAIFLDGADISFDQLELQDDLEAEK